MIEFPNIDPILFKLGPLQIRWYGLAYIVGILGGFKFFKTMFLKKAMLDNDQFLNCISYIVIGIILGGRIGYVLIYDLTYFLQSPLSIFMVWNGGMSFHGGALGSLIAIYIFSRYYKKNFFILMDIIATGSTIGIFFGRIANFINGELYGRVTSVPWGMVFPNGGLLARHPSQLYEAFFEGILLFVILYIFLEIILLPL